MDKDYFINGGIPPPQFETSMPFPWSEQSFFHPTSSIDQFSNFDSTWMSSTASAASNDTFALRELIGKLGNSTPSFPPQTAATAVAASPKRASPILDPMGNSMAPLPCLSADPGFAERAAKFSCFGSRSCNGRTGPAAQFGEPGRRSSTPLIRVSSTPTLVRDGSPLDNEMEEIRAVNSNEESSVSEQIPSGGETASKTTNELNSRKRKAVTRGKTSNSYKGGDGDENGNVKRTKAAAESSKNETKMEEETNDESDKKTNQKPPEPPKDYIHVRARRGQATDSHSLAERVRREKISERMKLLQDLVPGCNKVTGKALMLDEIINYVQSLQRQVEFLSMKLSSVNPDLDSENLVSKDMFQTGLPQQQMYPLDSAGPAFYHQQQQRNNPVDPHPFDAPSCRNLGVDGFTHQFPTFTQDDLNSIVFAQNQPLTFPVQNQASNMKVEL